MKVFIIGVTALFLSQHLVAQTGPGGVGTAATNVLWLSADNGVYNNAGTTPAANNDNVQQWNDRSGNGRNASQSTLALRPNYITGVRNGFPGIRFTEASDDQILSTGVTSANEASIWAVASYSSLPTPNDGIIQAAPAGQAFSSGTADKVLGLWVSSAGSRAVWGRGVQSNSTQIDIPQVAAGYTNANTFYIFNNIYGNSFIRQYVNDNAAGSAGYNNTLRSWSDFGIGRQGTESWNGDIMEVIAYNVAVNSAQRIIISNYLAAKYDLALTANDVYAMDGSGYDYEVAGIGRVDASNIHSDAQGSGIVRISSPSDLENNEFLMWGHDNGALTMTATGVPTGVTTMLTRKWRVSETGGDGDVGSVTIQFDVTGVTDFTSLTACDAALAMRLLVDTDNDNSFADETPIQGAVNVSGNLYSFSGVTAISDQRRFTIGFYNPAINGPAGIGNVTMWWRADAGVTSSSGLISAWADQSGNGNNLSSPAGFRPATTTSAAMNGQPVVRYASSPGPPANYFSSSVNGPGVDNLTLAVAVNGTSYQSLFRFQNTASTFVVYPWEGGGGRVFISSSDGGTGGGVNTGLLNSANNVGVVRYRRNTTSGMEAFRNGSLAGNKNSANAVLPTQPFFSGIYNPNSDESPLCDVGEMIVYYSAVNDAQLYILQNYLAAKFNATMSANDIYRGDDAASGNFDYDVAGIGRTSSTSIQSDSRGTGIVRVYNASGLGDDEFLMWGHNNQTLNTRNTVDVPATVQGRLNRVWRVSELNVSGTAVDVGNVNMQFDLSGLQQPITASDLRLLIDHDGDGVFNEGGTLVISGAQALACDNYLFAAVPGASLANARRFTIGSINITQTPLPVTLLSFTGFVHEGDAHLKWSTVSESDNDYFTIERSSNGTLFAEIGQVDGSGTTSLRRDYVFTDDFIPYGKNYYRLRQTDFDGTSSYSEVIVLNNSTSLVKLIAVPNPTTPSQSVRLRVTGDVSLDLGDAEVTVVDAAGRQVPTTQVSDGAGQLLINFNPSQAAGIYIISLRAPALRRQLFTRVSLIR